MSEYIRNLFPLLDQITDEEIQKKVVEVWLRVWKESKFERIEDCPQYGDYSVVEHTRATTKGAVEMAKIMEQEHGLTINYDYLIAAGLLHDVDKLLAYTIEGDKKTRIPFPHFPHGVYTAFKALEVGLPREIAHLICIHSPSIAMHPQPPVEIEGIILEHMDLCDAEALRRKLGLRPILRKIKFQELLGEPVPRVMP